MPDQAGRARDPLGSRVPTSHERSSGLPWDASYRDGMAPWDIGRPQPALERLIASTGLIGPVLDVGCGTGDNALRLASIGLDVVGVDVAPTAIETARKKATHFGTGAEFAVADALQLPRPTREFRTVFDCGLFHTFDATEQARYARSIARVTARDGRLYVLCFSDQGTPQGPHPVSQADLRRAFQPNTGWIIASIEADFVYTRLREVGIPAWLVTVTRLEVVARDAQPLQPHVH